MFHLDYLLPTLVDLLGFVDGGSRLVIMLLLMLLLLLLLLIIIATLHLQTFLFMKCYLLDAFMAMCYISMVQS